MEIYEFESDIKKLSIGLAGEFERHPMTTIRIVCINHFEEQSIIPFINTCISKGFTVDSTTANEFDVYKQFTKGHGVVINISAEFTHEEWGWLLSKVRQILEGD